MNCPKCGMEYTEKLNPHYVPSVGHYASLDEAITPYYTCEVADGV